MRALNATSVNAPAEPALPLLPPRAEMVQAYLNRDPAYLGVFYVAVRTTGVFCRPTCRPPRPARPENVEFYASVSEALDAGYRPCRLCRPLEPETAAPVWVKELMRRMEAEGQRRWTEQDLRSFGVTPERARRWFLQHYGLTFVQWSRARRLAAAFTRIQEGETLDDAAGDAGYESLSGFREAFRRLFGDAPGRSRDEECLATTWIESPLGGLLVAATREGLCLCEFVDRRSLVRSLRRVRQRFGLPVVLGEQPHLTRVRDELAAYFAGQLDRFAVPLRFSGTPFQEKVWRELGRIPYGQTISYEELARRIGQPTAMRAVSQANGANCLAILVPCHRVIGKNGELTGYGGGLWRKRLLLALEQGRHPFPEFRES